MSSSPSPGRSVARKTQAANAADLLAWYDRHRRRLPWRALPGVTPDPYAVWLSEVMLQQTTVTAVKPYFENFLARWPTVSDLATAKVEDVMTAWAGLGYYARARNLYKCAGAVAFEHAGAFPDTEEGLRALPGIGPYTAAAIAAIAFGRRAVVVDGNVERVMARLFAVTDPLPKSKPALVAHAGSLTPDKRAGDYAQAVMDLGATVCTPKSPACALCPWSGPCAARAKGLQEQLPAKRKKAGTPTRYGIAFWMVRKDGAVLLRRRDAKGLLGGMTEVPSTDWRAKKWTKADTDAALPFSKGWRALPGTVTHTFTHFHLELAVLAADLTDAQAKKLGDGALWTPLDHIGDAGLPSVMAKIAKHAMK
ncbi:MAG: A/G-specific adenine glycosylase, partial [Rhodospirillaceae bacterium]|nr:A/G-specific adenine glycosylase [Rhodospirillaceae bacterium]